MKIFKKKINIKKYLSLALIFASISFVGAQEVDLESGTADSEVVFETSSDFDSTTDSGNSSFFGMYGLRAGVYFDFSTVTGLVNQAISMNIGGGAGAEIDFCKYAGAGLKVGANVSPVATEKLQSVWNLKASAEIHGRFEIGSSGFIIQPEVAYGMIVYFPKKADNYFGELADSYMDQFVQLGVGLRYAPPKLLNGKLEFEVCPYYIFSTESIGNSSFIGARVGAYYRL